jgi:hypothetical protein
MTHPVYPIRVPRAFRNLNPGNLRPRHNPPPWPKQTGVDTGAGGPFAQFGTAADGWCALGLWLLYAHDVMGLVTTTQKISVFAPPDDDNNTTSYCAQVVARVGDDADPHDSQVRYQLALAIAHVESNAQWPLDAIGAGINMSDVRWPAFRFATSGHPPPGTTPTPEPTAISEADALNEAELARPRNLS